MFLCYSMDALYRTNFHPSMIFAAQGSFFHCLGIFKILLVCISLNTHLQDHLDRVQHIMIQEMFQLQEINQIEKETCQYLK